MKKKEKKVYEIEPGRPFPNGRIKSFKGLDSFSFYYYLNPSKSITKQTYKDESSFELEFYNEDTTNVGDTLYTICELGGKKLHKELIDFLEDFYFTHYESGDINKNRDKLSMFHGIRQVLGFNIINGKPYLHYQNSIVDNREEKISDCSLDNDDHIEIKKGYWLDDFIELLNQHWDRVNKEYDISYKEYKPDPKVLKRKEEEEREEERLYELEKKMRKEFKLTKEQLKGKLVYDDYEFVCKSGDKTFKQYFNGLEDFREGLTELFIRRLKSNVEYDFDEDNIKSITLEDGEITVKFNYHIYDHVYECGRPNVGTITIPSKDVMKFIKENSKEIKTI